MHMAARDESGRVSVARSTATISAAQTAPIRIHHLTEVLCDDERALRRSLPDAAERLLRLTRGRSADAAAVEAALGLDPALVGPLVALAVAGLFGAREPVASVRDAVVRLGLEGTRDTILVIVMNGIAAAVPGFEARAEALRRRALAAAMAARLVARALRVETGHDFLVGLLHDIGELVLLQRAAEEGILPAGIFEDPKDGPIVLEAIAVDHPRVGAAICRAWGVPPAVAEAAELHHEPRRGQARLPAQLAAAADVIAWHVTGTPSTDPAGQEAVRELGLGPAEVARIIAEVEGTKALPPA
jgi:putative nucleotidyltransferase with HDIG domain